MSSYSLHVNYLNTTIYLYYYYASITNFDTYNNESIDNYLKSVEKNTIQYFIDENGVLSIIVRLSIPVEMGYFDTVIKLEN